MHGKKCQKKNPLDLAHAIVYTHIYDFFLNFVRNTLTDCHLVACNPDMDSRGK
jgi:hypothetical protein